MIGLIKKDLYVILANLSLVYLFVFIPTLIPILQNPSFALPIMTIVITFVFSSQAIGSFGEDEKANWYKNVTGMPITVMQEVISKYVLSAVLLLASTACVLLIGIVLSALFEPLQSQVLGYSAAGLIVGALYCSVIIPAAFRFGAAKCRYITFAFIAIPSILPVILHNLNVSVDFSSKIDNPLLVIILCAVLLALFVFGSISLSIRSRAAHQRRLN